MSKISEHSSLDSETGFAAYARDLMPTAADLMQWFLTGLIIWLVYLVGSQVFGYLQKSVVVNQSLSVSSGIVESIASVKPELPKAKKSGTKRELKLNVRQVNEKIMKKLDRGISSAKAKVSDMQSSFSKPNSESERF